MEDNYHDHDDRYVEHRTLNGVQTEIDGNGKRLDDLLARIEVLEEADGLAQEVAKATLERIEGLERREAIMQERFKTTDAVIDQWMRAQLRLAQQVERIAAWMTEQITWSKETDKNYDLMRSSVVDIGKLLREHIENQVKALAGIDARVVLLENGIAADGIEDEPTIDQDA
jgi:hypothetical protein